MIAINVPDSWEYLALADRLCSPSSSSSAVAQVFGRRQWRSQSHAPEAGLGKAPRHKIAGECAHKPSVQCTFWRSDTLSNQAVRLRVFAPESS